MTGFDKVKALAAHLPEVAESTSYGTPALKVRGKSFCRMWGEHEYWRDAVHDTEVLVVFCEVDEKPFLLETSGGALFTTPHYHGSGAVLVRLGDIDDDDLTDRLAAGAGRERPSARAQPVIVL